MREVESGANADDLVVIAQPDDDRFRIRVYRTLESTACVHRLLRVVADRITGKND